MLITILTSGTRGDTEPYLALGLALQRLGHRVRVAAFENFAQFVTSYGLEYAPIPGNIAEVLASREGQQALRADNPLKFLRSLAQFRAQLLALQPHLFAACQSADVIVYHPGAPIGHFAGQHLGIPAVLATPFPMVPTRAFPALLFYNTWRLGPQVNWLTHQVFNRALWMISGAAVKKFWQQRFGAAPALFTSPFGASSGAEVLTLVSGSSCVFPRPSDWPAGVQMAGYWFLDAAPGWQPPAKLLDFLAAGPPPVYVGFGSMGDAEAARATTELVVAALRQAGQRGVLATGWHGLTDLSTPADDMLVLEGAPHAWLFPRMAAVVHHGGAGTTAAGLRAGVPSVIVPFANDQFDWGRRVQELGVGAAPIPRQKLTAAKLAQAITDALASDIQQAARTMGEKIRRERGAEEAAAALLAHFKPARDPTPTSF